MSREYKISFGPYELKTFGEIGKSDEGLKYLAWLKGTKGQSKEMKRALEDFLNDVEIRERLLLL